MEDLPRQYAGTKCANVRYPDWSSELLQRFLSELIRVQAGFRRSCPIMRSSAAISFPADGDGAWFVTCGTESSAVPVALQISGALRAVMLSAVVTYRGSRVGATDLVTVKDAARRWGFARPVWRRRGSSQRYLLLRHRQGEDSRCAVEGAFRYSYV